MKCVSYLDNPEIMRIKRICPVVEIEMVETTCIIIDELMYRNAKLIQEKSKEDDQKIAYENIFMYAGMWGFGGSFVNEDEVKENYYTFNNLWKSKVKTKIPDEIGNNNQPRPIFDYQFDVEQLQWQRVETNAYEIKEGTQFTKIFVPTLHT